MMLQVSLAGSCYKDLGRYLIIALLVLDLGLHVMHCYVNSALASRVLSMEAARQ